jgi:precorrin-6B methylase 2
MLQLSGCEHADIVAVDIQYTGRKRNPKLNLLRRIVTRAIRNDKLWSLLDSTIVRLVDFARWQRINGPEQYRQHLDFIQKAIMSISPDLTVRHGPFIGMQYPEVKSCGSTLVPKILGSYERELHPVIEALCAQPYSEIVDIGCAEGYYAVGLAMRIKTSTVYAFDTNAEAVALCRRMADINGVSDRVITGAFCDAAALTSIPFTRKALVVCDCEGYEKHLFSDAVVLFLRHYDLLIEVHDGIDIETSVTLRQRFRETHDINVIKSVDDVEKARSYRYDEIDGYCLGDRKKLLAEQRECIMEWFYMTPKVRSV